MALKSNVERFDELKAKKREEAKKASSPSVSRKLSNSERYEKLKLENTIGFDTIQTDLTNMNSTINDIYNGWQTSETMSNTKNSVISMRDRLNDLHYYQTRYGSGASTVDEIAKSYQDILNDWDNRTNVYGYYQNADAFNTAKKKAELDKSFGGLTYDEVQEQMKKYGKDTDEYKYLSEYTGYSDLREFDKALASMSGGGAGRSFGGEAGKSSVNEEYKKKLEELRNQYALDNKFDLYKGYMDEADFAEKSQYKSTKSNDWYANFVTDYGLGYNDATYEYINNVDGVRDLIHSMAMADDYTPQQFKLGYHKLTEEEVAVYNYIYKEKGRKEAQKFLDDMEVTLTKRVYDEDTQALNEIIDGSVWASIGLSALSVPFNAVGAFTGALDSLGDAIQGKEYNPYGYLKSPLNVARDTRQYVGENIAEATEGFEVFGQNVPSFLYQTGMSVADTAVGANAFGKGFTVVMGLSSAQNRAKELKEAGASSEELVRGAMASGLFEMAFEKLSLDNLLKAKNADSFLKIIKETAKQAGIEGSEEFFTEVANVVFDRVNRGKSSDVYKMYEEYLARGFSEEEAQKKVMQEVNAQIGWAFVGGALSGTAMGSTSTGLQYHNYKQTGKEIRANDRVNEMIDMADLMEIQGLTPKESQAYKAYAEYAKKGITADNITNAQLGNLYHTAEREAIDTVQSKKTTDAQKTDAMKRLEKLDVVATSKPQEERARQQRVEELNKGEVTEVTATGNSTKIEGIRIEDGDTIVMTSEGEHKTGEMTFSLKDAEILSYAETMGEEKGNLLLSQYDGKSNVESFVESFEMAYAYGEVGMGADSVLRNKGVLTDVQASEIYKTAVTNKVNERQKAIDDINEKHSADVFVEGKFDDSIIDYDGTVTDGSKVSWKDLAPTQRDAITFAKGFSKATGVNITFIKSDVKDGKRVGKNGSYDATTNTIEIDVYAGIIDATSVKDSIIPTLSHEMTHWMKAKSPAMYSKMQEYALETLAMDGELVSKDRIADEMARMKEAHPDMEVTEEMAIDELVARTCEDMLSNSNTARKLLNQMSKKEQESFIAKAKKTFANLMEWVNELLGKYKSTSKEAEVLREYKDRLKQLSKMWDKALAEAIQTNQSLQAEGITGEKAINAVTEKVGVGVDLETESAYPSEQLSERTWTDSEFVQNRAKAIEELSKSLGASKKKAGEYIDAINSVARLIADDRVRLDYDSNIDEYASVMKPNSDYKWSIDMSTLCAKRLLFTGTFDAIQKMLPNTALDSDDIVKIRKMMMEKGYQVACGICYVESTRREIGTITADFIERYKLSQKTGKPITRINSSGNEVELKKTTDQMKTTADKSTDKFIADKDYTPTLAELNTTDIDIVKKDHPLVYEAYLNYMNARGQAKPKLLETRAEYKGEIAKKFARKKSGELNSSTISMNESGGLRLQSFSDFEIAHLIDMMQVVLDMSNVGLMSQAYTKVPEFAEVFGDTGVKINLSLIAKGSGLDSDGNLIFDDVEGINHEEAFRLREKFSKNVGTILVGKNDEHIINAMADSRIDYIIPFHKSSWKESLYDALGLTGYEDYTDTQHEKAVDGRKIIDFKPSEYWDYSKSGDENAQTYLEMCKKDGRIPKFPQFQGYEGYWKLLIDFKMYDNDGVGSPQTEVQPNFSMDDAMRILNDYEGGHRSFPVAQDVVDEFVAEYKKNHVQEQYSDRVADQRTLDFLNKQIENGEYATVYRSFQIIDGGLYAPMNAVDRDEDGKNKRLGYRSELGQWEMATESPEIAQRYMDSHPDAPYAKFDLDGVDNKTNAVAYNPYLHASNLVLNDQFSGAYRRNLVTVECRVPLSEVGAYKAKYAKDTTGWADWKAGTVAGKLMKIKPEFTRKLFISRYMLPVRIVPDSEVAQMYKEYLDGTDISVPWNVVTPSLREELEKNGVSISYNDVKFGTKVVGFKDVFGTQYSDRYDSSVYDAMGETEYLKKQNDILKADVDNLRERLRLEKQITHGNAFNAKQLKAVAKHLINLSKSDYDEASLVEELKEVYSYIVETPQLDWEVLMAKSYDVARNVLKSSKGYKVTNDYFKAVLSDIRKARITLSEEQMQEAKNVFGEKYRDAFMGRIMLVKNGTNLDQKWQEWSEKYPEIFDADITGADQIIALSDIYNSLREGAEMYQAYNDAESIRAFATEIYNQYWNVSTIRTTADKYDKQIKRINFEHRKAMGELREDYKKKVSDQKTADAIHYGRIIKNLRQQRDERVKEAKQLGKKMMGEYKDRAERNAKIQSITKKALTLNQWLTKNSRDEHIPEVMKAPVACLLNAIDFSSKQLLGMRGGQYAGNPTKKDISLSKALEQVHDMVQKINSAQIGEDEITEIYGTFADFPAGFAEDIRGLSSVVNDAMREVGDNAFVLNKMNLEQLETLDMIVSIIKSSVTKMNKFLAIRHAEGVANMSQQSIVEMDSLGKIKSHEGMRGKIDKLINWGNALPYYTFKRFGKGGQMVYEALQDGWDKFAFHIKNIIDYTESVYTSEEVKEWSEDIKEFDILEPATDKERTSKDYNPKYQKVQMSIPQIMSLYCLQKREQAKGHLMGGGMRISDIKVKNNVISQTEGVILSQSEIDMIVNSLTERQKEVADALQSFMNTVCTDWGNEVSMLRFGFKGFGEENYFPIQSDKNNLAVNDETEQNNSLFRLLNMSFTKGTIQNANNRIVVSDIFDVFAQHSSDMAKYNALALPVLDSFKWYNYKEKAKKGETQFVTKSLKQSMENAFGKDAQNYFTTFLRDINGEQSAGRDSVGGGFFTNAKVASVGFNARVVALQPTSYLRASAVINPKYLTKAMVRKPKVDMAEKYCGIALWKSLGFYDINVQRGVSNLIKQDYTVKDKIVEASMKGAEIADKITWGYLWNACELEIRDTQKNLEVGSEEYYEAVGKKLREVIYSTQVVDSTMTRSHMMRSKDGKDKMLTAFMSEPTLAYNMLQDCYYDWILDGKQLGSKWMAGKKNAKKMARVISAYAITNALCALVEAGFDAFRDNEEELTAEEFMELYIKNFAVDMSILNKIPYAKEAVSMLQGFSSSRTDTQWLQYIMNSVKGFSKLFEGEGNVYKSTKNLLRGLAQGTGIPFYNIWRDFWALMDNTDVMTEKELEEIFNETIGNMYPSLKLN